MPEYAGDIFPSDLDMRQLAVPEGVVKLPPVTISQVRAHERHANPHVREAHWQPDVPPGQWNDYQVQGFVFPSLSDYRNLPEGMRLARPDELGQILCYVCRHCRELLQLPVVTTAVKCPKDNSHYSKAEYEERGCDGKIYFERPGYTGNSRMNTLAVALGQNAMDPSRYAAYDAYGAQLHIDDGRTNPRDALFQVIANVRGQIVTLPDEEPCVTF